MIRLSAFVVLTCEYLTGGARRERGGNRMDQLYLISAVLGGTIFVCQFLLGLIGVGADHDLAGDHGGFDHGLDAGDHGGTGDHELAHDSASSWFLGVLSFRTVVAGLTFFGLGGLTAQAHGAHPAGSLGTALVSGVGALYAVAWTMRLLARLRADGTARVENAVGLPAVVYLNIPGRKFGRGKVTVTVQNRTMEYDALTAKDELPTGAAVQIVAVVDPETVEVAPLADALLCESRSNNP